MRGGTGALASLAALAGLGLSLGTATDGIQRFGQAAAETARSTNVSSTLGMTPNNVGFVNQRLFGYGNGGRIVPGALRPLKHSGWTNRRYQRAARKARNVKANRRAHRG